MCNGHFNNRSINLQILGHFEFLPFLPKNGRVESISTVSVITRVNNGVGRNLPTLPEFP